MFPCTAQRLLGAMHGISNKEQNILHSFESNPCFSTMECVHQIIGLAIGSLSSGA